MKKAKTLFISSVILATGFLAASLIGGNYQIKPNNMLACLSVCPVIPPHQTNIYVTPSDPKVNENVSIKTDGIPECPTSEIPTSCEWRWSGSVNRTTTNKPTGQFSTSFSSSGNKNIHVEVYSSMQGICGGELIQVAYGDISFNVTTVPDPTLSCVITANPNSGTAPLNSVDLTATVAGTVTGDINYYFDCNNDGTWEKTLTSQAATSKTAADLCDYSSAGAYTANAKVERGGLTDTCSTTVTVGGGGGGGTCSYWQEDCYSTPTPTPTPTPTITPTPTPTIPVVCNRAPFGPAIPETLCLVTVANGGTCVLTNNDGFTVRLNVPANAVVADSVVDLSIHNPTDYSQLSTTIGTSRLIGPKIVYIYAQDQNCQPISFLKDAIITFVYPNSYSRGYLESSFIVENTLSSNGSWNFLASSGNVATNSLVSVTKNLGYFGIFGRLAPIILGTATASPKPSPICPVLSTPTPFVPDRPTDAELIESFFVASLIDGFKNLRISWCEFISFLNFLLILLLFWLAFGKKWLNNSKEKDNSQLKPLASVVPSIKRENWFKKLFGSIAASFAVFTLVQKKAWKDYKTQSQERKLARQNGKSLSVVSLIIPETVSQNNANRSANPEVVQGPQFITFTEDKN